jgi:hypothetical protein
MLGVVHDVRRQGVEGEEVGDLGLLLAVLHIDLVDYVGVDDLVSWQKEVLHFLVSVVEFNHIFALLRELYDSPSLSSLATPKTSALVIGLSSRVSSSGIA